MNGFTITVLSVSGLIFLFGLYQVIKLKKRFWIPTLIFILLGIVMIILGQTVTVTGGSFADVMYTVFGVFALLIALIIGIITAIIQSKRAPSGD
ncbi:MAG TPA: hypothetical protein PLP48_01420 [Acholeplasmataceae bacterium]|nr:hypothetical protein [Acholeplasmataceae bacterium]